MGRLGERFWALVNNRWLVFVAAMWIQSCAGIGYLFGSISPVIKSSLSYNQKQIARLGVAKDLGDSVGFLAGSLSEVLPMWGALLVGALQNFVGYGWVWLVVTGRAPILPLWAVSIDDSTEAIRFMLCVCLVMCMYRTWRNLFLRIPIISYADGHLRETKFEMSIVEVEGHAGFRKYISELLFAISVVMVFIL